MWSPLFVSYASLLVLSIWRRTMFIQFDTTYNEFIVAARSLAYSLLYLNSLWTNFVNLNGL